MKNLRNLSFLFLAFCFVFISVDVYAGSKNFFSQLLKAYETYEEANILLWLTGDVGAEKRFGKELQLFQHINLQLNEHLHKLVIFLLL